MASNQLQRGLVIGIGTTAIPIIERVAEKTPSANSLQLIAAESDPNRPARLPHRVAYLPLCDESTRLGGGQFPARIWTAMESNRTEIEQQIDAALYRAEIPETELPMSGLAPVVSIVYSTGGATGNAGSIFLLEHLLKKTSLEIYLFAVGPGLGRSADDHQPERANTFAHLNTLQGLIGDYEATGRVHVYFVDGEPLDRNATLEQIADDIAHRYWSEDPSGRLRADLNAHQVSDVNNNPDGPYRMLNVWTPVKLQVPGMEWRELWLARGSHRVFLNAAAAAQPAQPQAVDVGKDVNRLIAGEGDPDEKAQTMLDNCDGDADALQAWRSEIESTVEGSRERLVHGLVQSAQREAGQHNINSREAFLVARGAKLRAQADLSAETERHRQALQKLNDELLYFSLGGQPSPNETNRIKAQQLVCRAKMIALENLAPLLEEAANRIEQLAATARLDSLALREALTRTERDMNDAERAMAAATNEARRLVMRLNEALFPPIGSLGGPSPDPAAELAHFVDTLKNPPIGELHAKAADLVSSVRSECGELVIKPPSAEDVLTKDNQRMEQALQAANRQLGSGSLAVFASPPRVHNSIAKVYGFERAMFCDNAEETGEIRLTATRYGVAFADMPEHEDWKRAFEARPKSDQAQRVVRKSELTHAVITVGAEAHGNGHARHNGIGAKLHD